MIIIEGCDGTGKTFLAKRLAAYFNYNYVKENLPKYDGFKYYIDRSISLPQNIVLDRFHLGEYVYPIVKNDGRIPLSQLHQRMVERILLTRPCVIIHAKTNKKFIESVFDNRGEDFVTKDDIDLILNKFDECIDRSLLQNFIYDVDKGNFNSVVNFLKDNYFSKIDRSNEFKKFESIGNIYDTGKIMLVGDCYNDGSFIGNNDKKVFSDSGGSSIYLQRSLELADDPLDYYITNGNKTGNEDLNSELLLEEIKLLKPRKIIALGTNAAKTLYPICDFIKIDHPQYWRRFKHDNLLEYSQKLI
jgi:hypothetical protein